MNTGVGSAESRGRSATTSATVIAPERRRHALAAPDSLRGLRLDRGAIHRRGRTVHRLVSGTPPGIGASGSYGARVNTNVAMLTWFTEPSGLRITLQLLTGVVADDADHPAVLDPEPVRLDTGTARDQLRRPPT